MGVMLEGWKDIANHLETISGRRRSRYTLMRWARSAGFPIKRDPSNRPYAESVEVDKWWKEHRYVYAGNTKPDPYQSIVYFLRDSEFVKIGVSGVSIGKRIEALQVGNPREMFLVATMPGTEALEKSLHARFEHLRVRGEWFKAAEELLSFISSLNQ